MSKTIAIAALAAGQQTWLERFLGKVKAEAHVIGAEVVDFFQHKAFPFVENFLKQTVMDELAMAQPFLEEAGAELAADLPKVFSDPGAFLGLALAIARSAWQKIQAKGIPIAESSLLTGAQAFLHNFIAANKPAT